MKILTLLRHAKSSWDDKVPRDFDRPLNQRGRRAAVAVGRELRAQGIAFDAVIASPAARVVETLSGLWEGYGRAIAPDHQADLYLASPATLLESIHAVDEGVERLLVAGHNPGLEQLALMLTQPGALRDALEEKYPTATVAEIALPAERWADVRAGGGALTRFIRPRDLDPELGPED